MMQPFQSSVSQWIASLRSGQLEAVEKLWARYISDLVALAQRRLDRMPRIGADADDLAQSVFLSLYRGAVTGRFQDIKNRDELWWLLLTITKQKIVDLTRRETAQRRGGGRVKSEAMLAGEAEFSLDQLIGDAPTPELLVMIDEQNRHLLSLLRDNQLRMIAVARIEGYSVEEIATQEGISIRSVERKLQLIRKAWAEELLNG